MQLCAVEVERALMTVKRSGFHSGLCPGVCSACLSHEPPFTHLQKFRGSLRRSLAAESPVRSLSGGAPGRPPHNLEIRGFFQHSFAWDALDPRAFPWPVRAWQAESDPHPRAAGAAPPGGRIRECSQQPWLLIPSYLPSHAGTSPQASRVASQGGGDGRQREAGPGFLGLQFLSNCSYPQKQPAASRGDT